MVVFPEDQDEMSPEQMLAENMQQENQNSQSSSVPGEVMEQEQIRELLSGIILDLDNYKQIYSALTQYVAEMNRSMVTVTGVSSGVDWFNNVNESKNQSSGVIIAQNGKQLLILTDYSPVKQACLLYTSAAHSRNRYIHSQSGLSSFLLMSVCSPHRNPALPASSHAGFYG